MSELPTAAIRDILFAYPATDRQAKHAKAAEAQLQALLDAVEEAQMEAREDKAQITILQNTLDSCDEIITRRNKQADQKDARIAELQQILKNLA